jgi:fumarate hydratase subunit alpha
MRKIAAQKIKEAVAQLCVETNCRIRKDLLLSFKRGLKKENSKLAREIFRDMIENARIAAKEKIPLCQDTGMAVIFLEIGQEVRITGGDLSKALNQGVRKGYREGYLRKSVVQDPLERKNTGDNTPAVIHTEIVPGNKLRIIVTPKGFGSENMSSLKMLTPSEGKEGIKRFVLETVKKAGGRACPPVIVGVGIGGTMDKAALLSKKALLRPLGKHNPKKNIANLEKNLLKEINKLGIGPQGLGGKTTALAVNVETFPTHIAGLPVAVNICCYLLRWGERVL